MPLVGRERIFQHRLASACVGTSFSRKTYRTCDLTRSVKVLCFLCKSIIPERFQLDAIRRAPLNLRLWTTSFLRNSDVSTAFRCLETSILLVIVCAF